MSQEDDVLRLVRSVLGTAALGAYRHGSAVLGGLRPHSDLDVLVVSRTCTTPEDRAALVEGLLAASGTGPWPDTERPVELTVVTQHDVRPWRYPPHCEFQYGEWLRAEFERGDIPEPAPSPDLAPLITITLHGEAALFGPPPGDVLDPVPHDDLRRALVAGVPELLAEIDSDTRNVVLTLARTWATLATGAIKSKDAAADWALKRLPEGHRHILAHARAIYLGDEEENWDGLDTRARRYAEHVAGVIEGISANPTPTQL